MRRYVRNTDETGLLHNDIISFGFNICQVYDPTERQIFIYRLVKEPIVVISLDSDDENANDAPQPIITIEIDSDSDTNDSGEEFLENLDDITSSSYISSHSSTSSIPYDSNCDDNASEGSDTFVVSLQAAYYRIYLFYLVDLIVSYSINLFLNLINTLFLSLLDNANYYKFDSHW